MPERIDFYLVNGSSFQDAAAFCQKLCTKVFGLGHSAHILARNEHETEIISRFLWEKPPESFLPNTIYQQEDKAANPVLISHSEHSLDNPKSVDILLILSQDISQKMLSYKRLALVIVNEEQELAFARHEYRKLKPLCNEVNIHDMRQKTAS